MRSNFIWYNFIRLGLVKFTLFFFYKKTKLSNTHLIPKGKPLLIVPNHQNSFMDAILITTNHFQTTSFLTRAQAFESKFMDWFLRSLNLLPVYRVRDGFSSIQKNEEIFKRCVDYLGLGEAVLVFAEANHDPKRRLRPFSKGFTRIAFDAEIQKNWELDLYILPVGVNYSDHKNSRAYSNIVFGEPIKVSDYKQLYEEDERKAAGMLKDKTYEHVKPLIMHVPKLDQYPLHHLIIDELEPDRSILIDHELMNKRVEKIEGFATPENIEKAEKILSIKEKYKLNLRQAVGTHKTPPMVKIFAPLYFLVWLNNFIPYQPIRHLVDNVIKDPGFYVSIKYVSALFLFPTFYAVVSIILLLLNVPGIYVLGYFVLSIMSSLLFKQANLVLRNSKSAKKLKDFGLKNTDAYLKFQRDLEEMKQLRSQIL